MKKIFKILRLVLMIVIVGVFFQQIIILVLPEGRKNKNDVEVYQMEIREVWSPTDSDWYHLKYDKINVGPYDVQYSQRIVEHYDDTSATVINYEAYCELCKELEIKQTYSNMEADYIVWKAKMNPKVRLDIVNVIARDDLATVYIRKSFDIFRSKNKSGRVLIVPIKKGIVNHAGMGDAYRFDFERTVVD